MSDVRAPARIAKWPFYLADAILSGVAIYALYWLGGFQGSWDVAVVGAALIAAAIAAWISIIPWLAEHRAQVKLAESEELTSSLQQIQRVEEVANQIKLANSQWQNVQDASSRTVKAASEIAEKMRVEAEEFMKFLQNAHDQERGHLRLEVEKMKRAEGDWLKVVVQIMDHVHALTQAGERSGQKPLIAQLQQFRNACLDVARRIGLVPFVPKVGEQYDERAHQLPDRNFQAPADSRVGEVLAAGYMFQGQLLRRSLVLLANPDGPSAPEENSNATEGSYSEELPGEAENSGAGPELAESNESLEEPGLEEGTAEQAQTEPGLAEDFEQVEEEPAFEESEPAAEQEGEGEPAFESESAEEPQLEEEQEVEVVSSMEGEAEVEREVPPPSPARDYAEEEVFEEIEAVDWEEDEVRSAKRKEAQADHHSEKSGESRSQGGDDRGQYPRQLPLV